METLAGKKTIYRDVLRQYERIRSGNAAELRERQEVIYKKIPRIQKIEEEIALCGIKVARMVLQKPQDTYVLMEKLQEDLTALRMEKETLLLENGYSPKDLEMQYVCKECQDTGYMGQKQCTCMKQKLMDAAYDQSNIRDILAVENFDNFDIRYYSSEKGPEDVLSPRENIQSILTTCLAFTEYFDTKFSNLLLYGSTGLGKTFLCNCIAKELLDQGKTVLYVTAGQLFKWIEEQKFQRKEDEEQEDYTIDVLEADLLILDDLGTEFSTILSSSELFFIINGRMLNKKPVIISTNLSPADFIHQYSDRVVSRLLGEYTTLKFFGEDIRVKKKFMK